MAIALTNRGAAYNTTDGTSFQNASPYTVTSGTEVLLFVANAKGSAPDAVNSVTDDAGNTYTSVATKTYDTSGIPTKRMTLFRMTPNASTTVTFTIDFNGATQTGCYHCFIEISGSKSGADVIVQSDGRAKAAGTDFNSTFSLAAFNDATNNVCIACITVASNDAGLVSTAPLADLASSERGGTTPTVRGIVGWATGEVLAPTFSWPVSVESGGIAVEVAIAAAGAVTYGLNESFGPGMIVIRRRC